MKGLGGLRITLIALKLLWIYEWYVIVAIIVVMLT